MAISTPTNVAAATGSDTTNASVYTTGATVLTAGRLYILTTHGRRTPSSGGVASVVHDAGGTPLSFALVTDGTNTGEKQDGQFCTSCWYVIPASTTASAAITITWNSGQSACGWSLNEIASGFDATGGGTTFPQVVTNNGGASTSATATMGTFAGSNTMTWMAVQGEATGISFTADEGRTELDDVDDAERAAHADDYQNPNGSDTSLTMTISSSVLWNVVAFEIQDAASGTTYNQSVAGGLTFGGALTKQTNKVLAGSQSFTGVVTKATSKFFVGTASFAGGLAKQTSKFFAGTLTTAGALDTTKIAFKSVDGVVSFAGNISRQIDKALAGALNFVGTLSRSTSKFFSGALSFTGTVAKQTSKFFTGALSFGGALDTTKVALKSLTGSLSFVGALQPRMNKTLTAAISFSGTLIKQTNKLLSGALSFSGTVVRGMSKALSGALSFSGSLAKSLGKAIGGTVSFVGDWAGLYVPGGPPPTLSALGNHWREVLNHIWQWE